MKKGQKIKCYDCGKTIEITKSIYVPEENVRICKTCAKTNNE